MNLTMQQNAQPVALTIAGLDPSGGAGIVADIRAFTAFGYAAAAAITSVTFQNDERVFGAEHLSAGTLRGQVLAVLDQGTIVCAKTGMLPTREIVTEVARLFSETSLPAPVLDPILRSSSGYDLIEEDALECMARELFPLARVVTPNVPEAERITGLRIGDVEGMQAAAAMLRSLGAPAVLIKGGHLGSQGAGLLSAGKMQSDSKGEAIDLLDNAGEVAVFRSEWIAGPNLRGTGCMLSAAIAACLGKNLTLEQSIDRAREFVAAALKTNAALHRG